MIRDTSGGCWGYLAAMSLAVVGGIWQRLTMYKSMNRRNDCIFPHGCRFDILAVSSAKRTNGAIRECQSQYLSLALGRGFIARERRVMADGAVVQSGGDEYGYHPSLRLCHNSGSRGHHYLHPGAAFRTAWR